MTGLLLDSVKKQTIADYSDGKDKRKNNYDFIRFFAAVLIIFSHSFVMVGGEQAVYNDPLWRLSHGHALTGQIGMTSLFILGGFLITESYVRSSNVFSYLRNRFLRILPGFIFVMLLMTFIVGPLISSYSILEYFGNAQTYHYLLNLTLFKWVDQLPGVFTHNPATGYINGSLWTIRCEIYCYFSVILLGVCRLLNWRSVLGVFLLSSMLNTLFAANVLPLNTNGGGWYIVKELSSLYVNFSVGMLFYLLRDKIVLDWKYALFALSGLLLTLYSTAILPDLLLSLLSAYLVFYFAYAAGVKFHHFAKHGDLSYGTYIYAWPIQQMVYQALGPTCTWWMNFTVSLPIIIVAALLSWHLLEKKALQRKAIRPEPTPVQLSPVT